MPYWFIDDLKNLSNENFERNIEYMYVYHVISKQLVYIRMCFHNDNKIVVALRKTFNILSVKYAQI